MWISNMNILENITLKPFTSMYVGGPARYFVEVKSAHELVESLRFANEKNLQRLVGMILLNLL